MCEERAAGRLRRGERVVDRAIGVRRERDREREVGVGLHVVHVEHRPEADQAVEGDDEVLEREIRVVGRHRVRIRAEEAGDAIAAPVHVAAVDHAAQRLRGHRALHRVQLVRVAGAVDVRACGDAELDVDRRRRLIAVGVAEVPRQVVHVAEHVAAGARGLAVRGGGGRVVEEGTTGDHLRRLGRVQRRVRDFLARAQIEHGDAVVEARRDEQAVIRVVEREAARTAARDGEVAGAERGRIEGVGFDAC